jgi:hypothetical protein
MSGICPECGDIIKRVTDNTFFAKCGCKGKFWFHSGGRWRQCTKSYAYNVLTAFFDECIKPEPNVISKKRDLYEALHKYCQRNNISTPSARALGLRIKRQFPVLDIKLSDKKRTDAYKGIRILCT